MKKKKQQNDEYIDLFRLLLSEYYNINSLINLRKNEQAKKKNKINRLTLNLKCILILTKFNLTKKRKKQQ